MDIMTDTQTKHRRRLILAVDPDSDRDGVVTLELNEGQIKVNAWQSKFGRTLAIINTSQVYAISKGLDFLVIVEAGWLNKGNYHLKRGDNLAVAAAKGVAQGRNHQRGLDIVDYCEYNRLPVRAVLPLVKKIGGRHLWRGRDGKITQEEVEQIIGGPFRVIGKANRKALPNQEARDALLLAWNEAGLPVRVKPNR